MYPRDDARRLLVEISAGCDCGWRSPRWVPKGPAEWFPYSLEAGGEEEARGLAAGRCHLEQEGIKPSSWSAGQATEQAPANVIPLKPRAATTAPARLELRHEASGPRHYLAGAPSTPGTPLDLRIASGVCRHAFSTAADEAREGVWLRGRYEWNFQAGSSPRFFIELGNDRGECEGLAECPSPPNAVLRWPV
jgi:hypothetical protein